MEESTLEPKLVLSEDSPVEKYEELYSKNRGYVFKVIPEDYETVMLRIIKFTPKNMEFEVFPINPGTPLYTVYGCDHCVVTHKEILDEVKD